MVVLHGTVDAGHQKTTYWFEVGPTTAYGSTTPPATLDKKGPVPVMAVVSGLLKSGTYHARLVARNDDGAVARRRRHLHRRRADPGRRPARARRRNAGANPNSDPGSDSEPIRTPTTARRPSSRRPRRPSSARPSASRRRPATSSSACRGPRRVVALTDAASIPVGSIVDTRKGTVALSSALPGDDTQTGTFHGGLFEVRQPTGARGMTELVLRGPQPNCTGDGTARAAGASAEAPAAPRCGAATITGASARAAATASPPSAARRGTSRTAATAR